MTPSFYDSLVDLQDKLHTGLGRKRTILSMGTYDLDKVSAPFRYDALPPHQIQFVPLNRDQSFNGMQLMEMLESDLKLKKFLPIIRDSPLYPVLLDSNGTVLSLPPIINGNSSKITLSTRNIFIDVTGTDATKVGIALNILATSFAQYCETPNTIESVQLLFPSNPPATTPDTRPRLEAVSVEYINRSLGLALSPAEICDLLKRMMLESEPISADFVRVTVPPTRSDVIHVCDVMEDVAISYGFNRLPARLPPTSCVGATAPLNKFTDLLRREIALTGFTEVLTFSLCSHAENFAYLKRADPGNEAVVLSNPKTSEFEVVHTSLIPAMLKTIASNKKMPLPIKIFQITDVVLQDPTHSVGARNERRVCAVYCGMSSGFEVVHGLLDRIMLMLNVPRATANTADGYYISSSDRKPFLPSPNRPLVPTFFPGRQAHVHLNGRIIGAFGIVHPEVAASFDAPYVSSLLEINIEPLL